MRKAGPRRSADLLVGLLLNNPALLEEVRNNPQKLLALAEEITTGLPQPALVGDVVTYRIVVIALGAVAIGGIGGGIALSLLGEEVPEVLTALGAAAIGALAGILTPMPRQ